LNNSKKCSKNATRWSIIIVAVNVLNETQYASKLSTMYRWKHVETASV